MLCFMRYSVLNKGLYSQGLKGQLLFICLLVQLCCNSQTNKVLRSNYLGGNPKVIAKWMSKDTVQFLRFHRNGQIKDSLWIQKKGLKEKPFGTERRYYKNGRLKAVVHFATIPGHFTFHQYYKNGRLYKDFKNPGLFSFYSKDGALFKQFNMNKNDQVKVPRKYRKQRHLKSSGLIKDLQQSNALLSNGTQERRFKSERLITLFLKGDTNGLTLCNVEGFTKEAILLSKFDYDTTRSKHTLRYDSSFAISFSTIDSIYYSKKNTHLRYNSAKWVSGLGLELFLIPLIIAPIVGIPAVLLEPAIIAIYGPGLPVFFIGNRMYKKMVPKKYDMKTYKILLKNL